ncbi:cytochrome P450 [Chiua virens]|nr:cytochrome P450 [Chiua virens]
MSFIHDSSIDITLSALPWTYIAGGAAAATVLVLLSNKFGRRSAHKNGIPLPPGPAATWFWQDPMPKERAAFKIEELVEQHGPVISFRQGRHVTVVIGRMDAAAEIMEKENAALVDRPHSIALTEIFSDHLRLLVEPAGEHFRHLRRAVHSHLQPKVARMYEEIQTEAAKVVILDILNNPKQHAQHVKRYASSVILRVAYGKSTPTSYNDPELLRIRQILANFGKALAQTYLVDYLPWLKYVPGYGGQLKVYHQIELDLFRQQLDRVKKDMAQNSAGSSFGKALLEHNDEHQFTNDQMAFLAGSFFAAGSDTTAAGISTMIMAAACYPDAQARVQDELDDVVGSERVPTFEDWDMLPQLQAFVLEALRWRPVTPQGFAHRATKDIIWKGQCIPAGATVIGSHWAISRDPVAFPDPDTFDPQRWLTEDGTIKTDMRFYTFGFGRRVCPGQHVANRSLYMNIALLLWSFRILQKPEALIDTEQVQEGVASHPKPFEAEFVPRIEGGKLRKLMTD